MYTYYSSLMIGHETAPIVPGNRVMKIENYSTRRQTPIEGVLAWGSISYEKPLPADLAAQYELEGPIPAIYSPLTDGNDE